MSFESLLRYTCTIQTKTVTGQDNLGHDDPGTFADTFTNVKCNFVGFSPGSERVQVVESMKAPYLLDLLSDQAITEEDRVTAIVFEDGTSMLEGATFLVRNVRPVPRNHHKVVHMDLVR